MESGRTARKPQGRIRWVIAWTLFLSTVINYISRQSFSVLSPAISAQLRFTHEDLAKIFGSFQFAYALAWLVGGPVLDRIGVRKGLSFAVILWSAVNALSALVGSVAGFVVTRFLLGIGEGFNWPGASKTVAEWFPDEERGMAVAIFDSGSSVGGALASIALPVIALWFGWRPAFIFTGILGFLWLALWLYVYHPLDDHPRVSEDEKHLIRGGSSATHVTDRKTGWLSLLANRNVWGIILGRSLTDPIWWFYVFWLPQYLADTRGFSLKQLAAFGWIPFVAADLGNLTAGYVSSLVIRRGMPVLRARILICIVSCIPILAGIPAARTSSPSAAIALVCIALWGFASWSTMGLTFPSDLLPQNVVATVTGLSGFAAGLAGTAFTVLVGNTVGRFGYTPAFFVAALLPVLATVSVVVFLRSPRTEQRTIPL
ncbi:MAG: MFS transporter [Acidobacteria bacterium]|nr:MFS transporter [Acidobacteriota bacterium]